MKRLFNSLIVVLLVTLVLAVASATAQRQTTLKSAKSYANSQIDTVESATDLGIYDKVTLYFNAKDSVDVKIYVDTKLDDQTSWAVKDSTTITSAVNGGFYNEWVLRSATADKIPGIKIDVRYRFSFAASANGTTSATYHATQYYVK